MQLCASSSQAQQLPVLKPSLGGVNTYTVKEQQSWQKALSLYDQVNEAEIKYSSLSTAQQQWIDSLEMGMGPMTEGVGCSWYCGGGPYKITASDNLLANGSNTYVADNIHDFNLFTPWVPDTKTGVIGKSISFYFEPKAPRVTSIIVYNGYIKNKELWQQNGRVKKLKMYINQQPYAILELVDEDNAQEFKIPPTNSPVEGVDLVLTFEILEVYPGTKYKDVVLSEINFDGIDVH